MIDANSTTENFTRRALWAQIDLDARRKRIEEIDRELEEIEKRIAMYKRDLELI